MKEFEGPPRRTLVVTAYPIDRDSCTCVVDDATERVFLEAVRRDFVANISHELRTPIGALALLAETITDEPDPAVVSRLAGRLSDEAHRANGIVEDLLELSRLEGGALPALHPERLRAVVAAAIERVTMLAAERDVTVIADDIADLVVAIDRRQITSALANLVDNAIRYSDRGGVVRVSAALDPLDGTRFVMAVADSGIGIPRHDQDRIFERFYRVDRVRHRETGGTGLGLAIVRHVATNHGGTVRVTSIEGAGAEFVFSCPLGATEEE